MCDTSKTITRTKMGEQLHTTTTTRNAGEDAAAARRCTGSPAAGDHGGSAYAA